MNVECRIMKYETVTVNSNFKHFDIQYSIFDIRY
jgi:hypothetical protein